MRQFVFVVAVLFGTAAAQTLPNMQAATPAQKQVISRNAKAFMGGKCSVYGFTLKEVPASITASQRTQATAFAFDYMLRVFRENGVTPSKMRRASDGGGEVYFAADHYYLQLVNVNSGGKRYTATFACGLK